MIKIDIEKTEDTITPLLESLVHDMPRINRTILGLISEEVISTSQRNYLRGQSLGTGSGALRRSLAYRLVNDFESNVGTNLKYAAIHEFGGFIRPKRADYLTFKVNGRWVRTREVEMPARPYLKPALSDVFASGRAERIGERKLQREINRREK